MDAFNDFNPSMPGIRQSSSSRSNCMLALNASSMASMACSLTVRPGTTSAPQAKRVSFRIKRLVGNHPPRDNGLCSDSVRLRPSMGRVGLYAELHDAVERTAFAEGARPKSVRPSVRLAVARSTVQPRAPYRRAIVLCAWVKVRRWL